MGKQRVFGKNNGINWLVLVGLVLAGAMGLTGAPGAWAKPDLPSAEEWLDESAVLFFQVPSAAKAREAWDGTRIAEAWRDVAVELWLAQQVAPEFERLRERFGAGDLLELVSWIEGEVALGLEPVEDASKPPVLFAVADFGTHAAQVRERIASEWNTVDDPGVSRVTVHTPRNFRGTALASCWVESKLVLCSQPEALEERVAEDFQPPSGRSLEKSDAWRETRRDRLEDAHGLFLLRAAPLYDQAVERLQRVKREAPSAAAPAQRSLALLHLVGFDTLDTVSSSIEIRGEGFFTRQVVRSRGEKSGLMFYTDGSKPLRTPGWVTRDVIGFSAVRMRSPESLRRELAAFLEQTPGGAVMNTASWARSFKEKSGLEPTRFTRALGQEVAMISATASGLQGGVLLWEVEQPQVLDKALDRLLTSFGVTTTDTSFMGYHIKQRSLPGSPVPIHTAMIDGFLMVSTGTDWLKGFVTRRQALAKQGIKVDPDAPMGSDSLLPVLEEPFSKPGRNMEVVARSYSNPGPSLIQMNSMLPLLIPMLNMQLKAYGVSTIPYWITSKLPPIFPFAEQLFPVVERTLEGPDRIVTESWSALDPLASPFTVAASAIAIRAWLGPVKPAAPPIQNTPQGTPAGTPSP